MSVKVTKDIVAKTLKSIHTLVQRDVMVGIPGSTTAREGGEPITNAELGYLMENGSPANNIPARPHLVPGIERAEKQIGLQLKKGATEAIDGNEAGVMDALNGAGLVGQNAVRAEISSVLPPPLKPGTIAARKRRGRMGEIPLIDTGQYRNAQTYVIRKKT